MTQNSNSAIEGTAATSDFGDLTARDALTDILRKGAQTMLKAAIANGWLDEAVILETLLSIKRAGADLIITYHAKDVAEKLG